LPENSEETMKKATLAVMLIVSSAAYADGGAMRAGLWETKIVHQLVDGRDMSVQMAAAQAKMQAAMANMTAEQRQMMSAHMKNMPGQGGGMRICISPAMAAKHFVHTDSDGHCPSTAVSTSGNKTSFSFNCTKDGRTTTGQGVSTVNGDTVTSHFEGTSSDAKGNHTMAVDSEMTYLGADCQGIAPVDQLAKGAGH
jgi:hypothetical protein